MVLHLEIPSVPSSPCTRYRWIRTDKDWGRTNTFSALFNQSLSPYPDLSIAWLDKMLQPCANPLLASQGVNKMELQWHQASINTIKIRIFVSAESCCYNMIPSGKTLNWWPDMLPTWQKTHAILVTASTKDQPEGKSWMGGKKKKACLKTNTRQ